MAQRIYRETTYYLPRGNEGTGIDAIRRADTDAELGSAALLGATLALFRNWERVNGFVEGAAQILLPAGWNG